MQKAGFLTTLLIYFACFFPQESRRIEEVERLDLSGSSHNWNDATFHAYGGITVTSSVAPYGHWYTPVVGSAYYTNYYPVTNMFSATSANVNTVFASANSAGTLTFDLPTKVYVEYLRIYPYCGDGHDR